MSSTRISNFKREDVKKLEELNQGEITAAPVSYFSPQDNEDVEVLSITITNSGAQDRWVNIWLDQDGTTYDDTTVLEHEIDVPRDGTKTFLVSRFMNDSAGNLAMEAEAAGALTFTIEGAIRQKL